MANQDKDNKFTFSIIMSIYNVEKYLKESVDSVISQSLDFEKHVQLIIVNDGSTDGSLDIALEYQNKFPDNIVVVSQENQGLGSARNHGLEYVEGTYVNFLDADDYISEDTLNEVKGFFKKHHNEVDLVSIKIRMFERKDAEHPLNFKFKKNKVINLKKEPDNPQLHVTSSFIKASSFENLRFKESLVCSEDSNLVCKLLLEKKKFGVLKSPTYFYRKRNDESSIIDSAISKKDFFTHRLKNHFMDVIDYCLEKEGKVPSFIQYSLAYNIQWMITPDLPEFLSDEEKEEFMDCFTKVIGYLSIDAISSKKIIKNSALRNYLISKYYNSLHVFCDFKTNDAFMKSKNKKLDRFGIHSIWINSLELNDERIRISCSFNSMFDSKNIFFQAFEEDKDSNLKIHSPVPVLDDAREDESFFSETINYYNSFSFRIPISKDGSCKIALSAGYRNDKGNSTDDKFIFKFPKISFRKECRINSNVFFFVEGSNIVLYEDNMIKIEDLEKARDLIKFSGLFDEKFYLSQCKGFDKSEGPLDHYLNEGFLEGKNPSMKFNNDMYLENNPNLKDNNANPLLHYVLFGINEKNDIYPVYGPIRDRVLTKEIFEEKLSDDPYYEDKWEYLEEVIKQIVKFDDSEFVLELAPYKSPLVRLEDVMDSNADCVKQYPYSTEGFIRHDYTNVPYPIEDKEYDLVIACQILENCGMNGEQRMVFDELERISKRAIITLPYKWFNPENRELHMLDEKVFDYWAGDRKPVSEQIAGGYIVRVYEFE